MKKKTNKKETAGKETGETREVADLLQTGGPRPAGCLIYVSSAGPGKQGRSVRLKQGEAVIGRDGNCDLVLDEDSVSRRHVRLTPQEDGILIEDLGSTNGTTYLGRKIGRATLPVGARLGVGDCRIDLLPLPESGSLPLSPRESYGDLVGASLPMRRLYSLLQMLEGSDVPVLVEGETGTGKELVARALHEQGLRAGKPFVVIDCGNLPVQLIESELFGHRKGAFTGAVADHAGAFETASNGTVFLDEIGELPLELQPKLLRILESGQVKRLGDVDYASVDFRIIVATKRSLADEVARGHFREDLFFRIAVVQIQLPPLRERPEDIPVLARHLTNQASGGKVKRLDTETEETFMHSEWPGNVRELRNAVQRVLALGTLDLGAEVSSWRRPQAPPPSPEPKASSISGYRQARDETVREFDRAYLTDLMARFKGNLTHAAQAAGISRNYLRELLKKHDLY